jgi:putative transposase
MRKPSSTAAVSGSPVARTALISFGSSRSDTGRFGDPLGIYIQTLLLHGRKSVYTLESMILRKAHVYRLYPTDEQGQTLAQWIGAVRFTYNLALEQRRDWWRPGRRINFVSQCREITELRAEVDWIEDAPVQVLQQAVKDLDRAYANWRAGRARAPTPRKRGLNDAMRFVAPGSFVFRQKTDRWGELKLPKLGWVRVRWDRGVPGVIRNVTVSLHAGMWTAAAQYQLDVVDPPLSVLPEVGIDLGIDQTGEVFATFSTGEQIAAANHGKKKLAALARAQRKLARKKKGSNNRKKQALRVARVHAKIANERKDFLHKRSTEIARNHGVVVLGKTSIESTIQPPGSTARTGPRKKRAKVHRVQNHSIYDQGWGMFTTMLKYKLEERGGRLIEVSLDQGTNAGEDAAIDILHRSDSPVRPVKASRKRPRKQEPLVRMSDERLVSEP